MADPIRLLGYPEHELEVLDRVEGWIEAANLLGEGPTQYEQMAHVHRAQRVDG